MSDARQTEQESCKERRPMTFAEVLREIRRISANHEVVLLQQIRPAVRPHPEQIPGPRFLIIDYVDVCGPASHRKALRRSAASGEKSR